VQAVYSVREWEEDGGIEIALTAKEAPEAKEAAEEEAEAEEEKMKLPHFSEFVPFTEAGDFDNPELIQAEATGLNLANSAILTPQIDAPDAVKGGALYVTIGLVGKPSAGKSTFFNAATAFSRQTGGGEGAKVGAAPFTTIDPNLGWAFVPVPLSTDVSAPADAPSCGSEFGRDRLGRRLLPIMVKDVAGLVPGAYAGRGKGNKFLDDLTEACAFVQITDASGKSDVNGNVLDEEDGNDNVMDDVGWIRRELIMWIVNNVLPKFPTVVRKGRSRLHELFTGYRQSKHILERVLDALQNAGQETEEFDFWRRVDVHELISCFLAFRFPSVVALNKMDKVGAVEKIEVVKRELPMHGCFDAEGVCAEKEMGAVKAAMEGAKEVQCDDNVWKVLSKAVTLAGGVHVYPVLDLSTCQSLPVKRVGGASEVGEDHLRSIEARGGKRGEDCRGVCEVCLVMKEGSCVEDLYEHLKNLGSIKGMFVRAEGMSEVGGRSRQLKKEEPLGKGCRIIRIMTNRNRAHETGGEIERDKSGVKKVHRTKS